MKLVIIGNGLDCAHGLNTSYINFKKYVFEHNYQEYLFLKILFEDDFNKIDFWEEFEKNLGKRNFFNFVDKEILDKKKTYSNIITYLSNGINEFKKMFCEWIKEINENDVPKAVQKENINKILENSIILNFNYTDLLEKVYMNSNVYHIHGDARNIDTKNFYTFKNITFGHINDFVLIPQQITIYNDGQDNPITNEVYDFNSDDNYLTFIDALIGDDCDFINNLLHDIQREFEKIFLKNCSSIIKRDYTNFFEELIKNANSIDEIYILGHSINKLDKPYYQKIIEILKSSGNFNSIKWYVSHYNDPKKGDNIRDLEIRLQDLKIINYEPIEIN